MTQADLTAAGRGVEAPAEPITDSIIRQIRGSNLLLAGRVLSLAVGLVTQVLMVRYLSTTDFGMLAYGLSIVAVGQTVATFGLDRAIARFVPIYHERDDRARVLGTILMVAGTIVVLGTGVIAAVFILHAVLPDVLGGRDIGPLLLILVLLSPLQALDSVLIGLFAVFARPRAIFFRGYVLGPGLRLAAVVLAVVAGAGVLFVAAGFVVAAAIGSAIYGVVLYRMLQSEGLLERIRLREIRVPARAVLGLTIPLLTSDLIVVLIGASDILLLGYFRDAAAVASFAVVKPIAELNQIGLLTFSLLFVPLAARLFARRAHVEMNELYWQTAAWVALVSFPIFAVTFLLAEPLVVLLFGRQYETSGLILTILALGAYLQASTGFNGTTLMVYGRIRYIVSLNGLAVVLNLALNLALIPRYGAVGAAVGTTTTYALHNVLKQAALAHTTSVQFFHRRYTKLYVTIGASAVALAAVRVADPSVPFAIGAALLACLVTYGANRRLLRVAETFPELAAVPFARFLFGRSS